MHYDESGQQVAKVVRDFNTEAVEHVSKYYSQYAEVTAEVLATTTERKTLKSYFFGGQRVATRINDGAAWETAPLASLGGWNPVQFATAWAGRPVLVVGLSTGAQSVAAASLALLFVTLFLLPPGRRRRAVVGLRVSRGPVLGIAILFATGTIPIPLLIQPAQACTGCNCPTPTPTPPEELRYFHYNHLGSPLMITDGPAR